MKYFKCKQIHNNYKRDQNIQIVNLQACTKITEKVHNYFLWPTYGDRKLVKYPILPHKNKPNKLCSQQTHLKAIKPVPGQFQRCKLSIIPPKDELCWSSYFLLHFKLLKLLTLTNEFIPINQVFHSKTQSNFNLRDVLEP